MNDTKNIIKITSILILFIGTLLIIYLFKNKYDEVEILSIRQEYNLIFTSQDDSLNIPLYLEKDDSFLSKESEIETVSISNDDCMLNASLEGISTGNISKYEENIYYEFIYSLKFPSYDDFNNPIYIDNCMFNILYKNGVKMSFLIGNVNVLFNTKINNDDGLNILYLDAVTNTVDNKLTIVGINITIYNSSNTSFNLNDIKINNEKYELDYMNYSLNRIDSKKNLSLSKNYSYYVSEITKGNMNIKIDSKTKVDIFIPLKYLSNIKIIDNIPLYISYEVGGNNKLYIQDDFTFFKRIDPINTYEVNRYVYSY